MFSKEEHRIAGIFQLLSSIFLGGHVYCYITNKQTTNDYICLQLQYVYVCVHYVYVYVYVYVCMYIGPSPGLHTSGQGLINGDPGNINCTWLPFDPSLILQCKPTVISWVWCILTGLQLTPAGGKMPTRMAGLHHRIYQTATEGADATGGGVDGNWNSSVPK